MAYTRQRMDADIGNAHVRKGRKDAPDFSAEAEEAQRLLDDPAFQRAYHRVRDGLIGEIERYRSQGQPEDDAYLLEVCRSLRTLHGLRKAIGAADHRAALKAANYRSQLREEDSDG